MQRSPRLPLSFHQKRNDAPVLGEKKISCEPKVRFLSVTAPPLGTGIQGRCGPPKKGKKEKLPRTSTAPPRQRPPRQLPELPELGRARHQAIPYRLESIRLRSPRIAMRDQGGREQPELCLMKKESESASQATPCSPQQALEEKEVRAAECLLERLNEMAQNKMAREVLEHHEHAGNMALFLKVFQTLKDAMALLVDLETTEECSSHVRKKGARFLTKMTALMEKNQALLLKEHRLHKAPEQGDEEPHLRLPSGRKEEWDVAVSVLRERLSLIASLMTDFLLEEGEDAYQDSLTPYFASQILFFMEDLLSSSSFKVSVRVFSLSLSESDEALISPKRISEQKDSGQKESPPSRKMLEAVRRRLENDSLHLL